MPPTTRARRSAQSLIATGTLCAGALLVTTPVLAQGLQFAPGTGPYLQLNVGPSWQSSPANTGAAGLNLDGHATGTAEKLTAGWQFTPMWGAELSYYHLGSVGISTASGEARYNTHVTTATATLSYPALPSLTLVGRAGIGYSTNNVSVSSRNYSSSSSKTPLVAGLGARYSFTRHLALAVDYDYLGKTGRFNGGGTASAQVLSMGLRYSF